MYQFERKKDLTYLRVKSLSAIPFIEHAFLTRIGGASEGKFHSLNVSFDVGDDPVPVRQNRQLIAHAFGLREENFFFLNQVHGNDVLDVKEKGIEGPPADGAVTNKKGVALAIKTADCVPIMVCDPESRVIAAIHAGWRGTVGNIALNAITLMEKTYGARRENMRVAIGPSIRACCYEVREDVFSEFNFVKSPGLLRKGGKFFVDLPWINLHKLLAYGIREENVALVDLCTACEEDFFFSHRRDRGITGRQLSFIVIKN